ncbi:glycoside hydrolase family 2 TIM barrel-domain containing protein [Aestuariivivens sediminis]|uniref:glycoside hydrolase family 2 TIM barrel-domain containing protein n=1 Tax=Aestuariivivens sediminis TaxID=2913557 RepID=UPI001F561375|nr:glycoside hydrolase family 2 TIM barrel-domain containing protein [Aestuariivivens sediminis]
MKIFRNIILAIFLGFFFGCSEGNSPFINKKKFNDGWSFRVENDWDSINTLSRKLVAIEKWKEVELPHTPRIEPEVVNNQWQGICWYRKNFKLSKYHKGKQLLLKFEGAMNIAEVWVNGVKLVEHHGGYLPFVVDFTEQAIFNGSNTVEVRLDNRDNPITGPKPLKVLDFNTYGGIHRNVWLIVKDGLHITDPILENKTASGGIFVTYPFVSDNLAKINVQTHVKNKYEKSVSFRVQNTVLKKDSIIAIVKSKEQVLKSNKNKKVVLGINVENPELWSPDSPHLYQLKTEILLDDMVVDQEITRIGIKTIKFVGQDFYLNGKKTFLRGVNKHQEYPHIGYALSDNANYRDAKKIKEAGFDYVRLSHYPHAPSFMDACDELGIVTIDAILGWQYFSEDKRFQEHVFQTARDLVRRDRNHASVLAWEVSLNESWMSETFMDSLHTIAHQEYPGDQCFTAGWQPYGYDIYLQARQHRLEHYDSELKKPYNVSEYGDWEYYAMNAGLNQDSWDNVLQADRSSRQLRTVSETRLLQQATNVQEAHNDNLSTPAFADGYWVMFDYNRGYSNDLEASGIMDIFRLPKPAYYFFQSQRDPDASYGQPMVHIANQWKKDSPLNIRIFSNCDEVELFLNGTSLGRRKPDKNLISDNLRHPPFTFQLEKFIAGKIVAKAYLDSEIVAVHEVQTPEKEHRMFLSVDLNERTLETNDMVFVYASIVDEKETLVTDYNGDVAFHIESGDAELIGENPVFCKAGIASILLKTNKHSSQLKISASSFVKKSNLLLSDSLSYWVKDEKIN